MTNAAAAVVVRTDTASTAARTGPSVSGSGSDVSTAARTGPSVSVSGGDVSSRFGCGVVGHLLPLLGPL
eukprot:10655627-Prorocentrum_lima.AAC.1